MAVPFAVGRPYPGLRPFESHEAFLFHGRQEHTRALLDRLATERFLAVVGTSGSGKSSLVRAGLLPALYRGYLVGASSRWRIAVMRPGNAPLDAMTTALSAPQVLAVAPAALRETLGRTSLGLAEAVQRAELGEGENVLLVVDQFEELFTFERARRHQDGGAEASLFVQSLLEAGDAYGGRLYVVITMRSDYLGQCARFAGLPEALNRGQYAIPHLTREQRREAIEKPALLAGVRIKPALIQRLLNDLGDDPGQLPVLQHALMRTFDRLAETGAGELDFEHYERAGGITHALDQHADSITDGLPAGPRSRVERLFRVLTAVEGGRAIRRPSRLVRIYEVLAVDGEPAAEVAGRAEVDAAIRAFAQPDSSLLVISNAPELDGDSVIDISHESLIKNWQRLQGWLLEETRSAEWFRSVVDDTIRHRTGEASLWRDPELGRALQLKRAGWNQAWARQYLPQADPSFSEVEGFLAQSAASAEAERVEQEARRAKEIADAHALAQAQMRAKRWYLGFSIALGLLLLAVSFGAHWWWQQQQEQRERELAFAAEKQQLSERATALSAQVSQAAADQERLARQLNENEEKLSASAQTGSEAETLRNLVADLKNQVAQKALQESNARQTLQQTVGGSTGSEYEGALRQIAALQDQLKQVRGERDDLQGQLENYGTVQVRDAGYWKSRFESADAEANQLRQAAAARGEPLILALPQYSLLPLGASPFGGGAFLFVGDLDRVAARAHLFVSVPNDKSRLAGFREDKRQAQVAASRLQSRVKCPGFQADGEGTVWCFEVDKARTLARTQPLGQFRFGESNYAIVATGWAQDTVGGTDVMTVVVYPAPATASRR